MKGTAIIAGATGLIGRALLQHLLHHSEFNRVIILVRRMTGVKHAKLTELVIEFDHLDAVGEYFKDAVVFCALGTTIKAAKTKEAFRKVDYEYPLQLGKLAKKYEALQFHIVTAMGADANSSIFYSRVKGEVEEAIKELGLLSLHIYHPSILLGRRNEFRLGERIAMILMKSISLAMKGKLSKYKGVEANKVAAGMVSASQKRRLGEFLYEYKEIHQMAAELNK
jgi:uncharacterized protein YbjT (DUF2867 family)